jgi:glutathione S-transferase
MNSHKTGPPPPIELGYWNIRLKAHHLRLLLKYVGLDYIEWNPRDVPDWRRKKDSLYRLNPLVTIPFYREGDLVVSKPGAMAMAICMRAGRKDLIGNTPQKLVLVRTLQSSIGVVMNYLMNCTLRGKEEIIHSWKADYFRLVKPELEKLNTFLGDQNFLLGEVTIADFELNHMIGLFQAIIHSCGMKSPFTEFINLMNVKKNVDELPGVKEFKASS